MAHRRHFPFLSNVQLFLLIFLAVVVIRLAQLQPATEQTEQQQPKKEEEHRLRRCRPNSNLSVPPATNADASENDDDFEETAGWSFDYEGKEESAEVVEEMMKNQISFKMARVERGKSGEFAIEAERQMQIDEQQQQEKVAAERKSSQSAAEKERTTLEKLFDKADEVERALAEVELDWRHKVDKKRHGQMEKELRRMEKERKAAENLQPAQQQLSAAALRRKLYVAQLDTAKFRADVEAQKPCDAQPLQVVEYYLFKWSSKLGIYHAGLYVCGIEIHFIYGDGIVFWKPMEYATLAGGMHRKYRPIYYGGKELYTKKAFGQIVAIVSQLKKTFNPSTYNMLSRNCLLFVRTFVRQLTGLTNKEEIEWPWSAIHPLKKPEFALKKLKERHFKNKSTEAKNV